jgi:hypothetical protein
MKRFLFAVAVLGFLCSHPVHTKAGPILSETKELSKSCLSAVRMSLAQQSVYNRIEGIIPDVFCCFSDVADRITCLDGKADALIEITKFMDSNFTDPLWNKVTQDFKPSYPHCQSFDLGDINSKIKKVKCELNHVGESFSNFENRLNEVN